MSLAKSLKPYRLQRYCFSPKLQAFIFIQRIDSENKTVTPLSQNTRSIFDALTDAEKLL